MFYYCSSLTELDLSKFNTDNVTDMFCMFDNCSSLKKLDLSKFNTDKVEDVSYMFNNCFEKKQTSFLICKASTIKHVTEDNNNSCLKFVNNNVKIVIENNNNLEQVYTCSVKRVGNNPQIIDVEEYQPHQ
jgi:surface protein